MCFTLNSFPSGQMILFKTFSTPPADDNSLVEMKNVPQLRLITSNNNLSNRIAKRSLSNPVLSNYNTSIPSRTSEFPFKATQLIATEKKILEHIFIAYQK